MALLEKQIVEAPGLRIIATDHSPRAIENSKKNAIAAGVAKLIDFSVCDFTATEIPSNVTGIFYVNPEYGERMGDVKDLEETYSRIGDFMKQKCGGYFGYVFTGNLELAKKIGLKAKRRIEFYTATIDCRLLEYELYSGSRTATKEIKDVNVDYPIYLFHGKSLPRYIQHGSGLVDACGEKVPMCVKRW